MTLDRAVPVLASLNIERSVAFYCSALGFRRVHVDAGVGIVERDAVQIHFWPSSERHIAENTSCRIHVRDIDALFGELEPRGVIHPNGPLADKPWGSREFTALDPDGNALTFVEWPTRA